MNVQHVVIIGGGSAGVMFANRMRREFSENELELTVIEKSDKHFFQPAFPFLVFDQDEEHDVVRPAKELFYEGINLLTDSATKIHPKHSAVTTAKHGTISYDYLVIATGAKLNFDEPEGMKEGLNKGENVFTFYTLDGALKLRDALRKFDGGTIVSSCAELPVKCYSSSISFLLMAEDAVRMLGKRSKYRFVHATPLHVPFSSEPYLGKLNSLFESRGIESVTNFAPGEVDYTKGVMKAYSGKELNFDLLCITPPHVGADVVQDSEDLGDAAGWVTFDKYSLLSTHYSSIHAIGDATPTSKTIAGARVHAKVLTERFKALLRGKQPKALYDKEAVCPIFTRFNRAAFTNYKQNSLKPLYWNLMLKGLI